MRFVVIDFAGLLYGHVCGVQQLLGLRFNVNFFRFFCAINGIGIEQWWRHSRIVRFVGHEFFVVFVLNVLKRCIDCITVHISRFNRCRQFHIIDFLDRRLTNWIDTFRATIAGRTMRILNTSGGGRWCTRNWTMFTQTNSDRYIIIVTVAVALFIQIWSTLRRLYCWTYALASIDYIITFEFTLLLIPSI